MRSVTSRSLAPERYRMVQLNDEIIGFFAVRLETDYLYIHTILARPSISERQGLWNCFTAIHWKV